MKTLYSPGCGILAYKPDLAKKVEEYLVSVGKADGLSTVCCMKNVDFEEETLLINTCPGCDKRFKKWGGNTETKTLWEVLIDCPDFDYPDYGGMEMSIHDSCDTKMCPEILDAVRELLRRMNIRIIEPENTREKATCCGESYRGAGMTPEEVAEKSTARAQSMPCKDVAVYCAGCAAYMALGGASAHHLIDLLFGEDTTISLSSFEG